MTMNKKPKAFIGWGTLMLNPNSAPFLPKYVGVLAPTKRELRSFYYAILGKAKGPFNPEYCRKIRVSKLI